MQHLSLSPETDHISAVLQRHRASKSIRFLSGDTNFVTVQSTLDNVHRLGSAGSNEAANAWIRLCCPTGVMMGEMVEPLMHLLVFKRLYFSIGIDAVALLDRRSPEIWMDILM